MHCLILLAVVAAAVAAPENVQRIVGGSDVEIKNFPFVVNMQFGLIGGLVWRQRCAGSLLGPKVVLSAGHCYYLENVKVWRVLLGTSSSDYSAHVHDISEIILHPNYNDNTMENDLGLIHLTQPAQLSENIAIARIPGPNYIVAEGSVLTALGWGHVSETGETTNHLQSVEVNSINQEYCVQQYANLKTQPGFYNWPEVKDSMMCVGVPNGGKDACEGDSGGPIVQANNIAVAMTSWGRGCGHPEYPGVKTRVSSYSGWIVDNAA